ncbi:uncharacterized protein MYCGRDRAFT_109977 [Zymoseptoria tritici IPO323]|uniref:Apple domain-containing protein n=1 Tax=Zymoseptoria tritici (strain CBS 115943 / IPO323) TaxID=336722 RepID=F9XDZ3_ZYMTI|nr:uncharacterized protein MYCGRDRAFT_109977 [Zymoseptoria tritici IPO323]EGP86582.1 hypothetical protein MYCGRDRAFT_109977 [Zymoseptoria tritici IPO323]
MFTKACGQIICLVLLISAHLAQSAATLDSQQCTQGVYKFLVPALSQDSNVHSFCDQLPTRAKFSASKGPKSLRSLAYPGVQTFCACLKKACATPSCPRGTTLCPETCGGCCANFNTDARHCVCERPTSMEEHSVEPAAAESLAVSAMEKLLSEPLIDQCREACANSGDGVTSCYAYDYDYFRSECRFYSSTVESTADSDHEYGVTVARASAVSPSSYTEGSFCIGGFLISRTCGRRISLSDSPEPVGQTNVDDCAAACVKEGGYSCFSYEFDFASNECSHYQSGPIETVPDPDYAYGALQSPYICSEPTTTPNPPAPALPGCVTKNICTNGLDFNQFCGSRITAGSMGNASYGYFSVDDCRVACARLPGASGSGLPGCTAFDYDYVSFKCQFYTSPNGLSTVPDGYHVYGYVDGPC